MARETYEVIVVFNVTGLVAVTPPATGELAWTSDLLRIVQNIRDWFRAAYEAVSGWIWPFSLLEYPLFGIYMAFDLLLTPIDSFGGFMRWLLGKTQEQLTIPDIGETFQNWIDMAIGAWNWIVNAYGNVISIISDWWNVTYTLVKSVIDLSIQGVTGILQGVISGQNILEAAWNTFVQTQLPYILNAAGVDALMDSKLKEWFPWYDTLGEFIGDIGDFFEDPLEWIYIKVDEFIGRYL